MNNTQTIETRSVIIGNPDGLHLRAASEVVRICQKYKSKVYLACGSCPETEGCSIIGLLMLTAGKGDSVTIRAEGSDAKEAVKKISDFFADGAGI
jgi:phosphotransferase system HPr (HPr) family protein